MLVVDGDHITRLEMFDEDHWDDALARADELANHSRLLVNSVTQLRGRWNEALAGELTPDWWSDDFIRDDRRSITSAGTAGRDEVYESIVTYQQMGGTIRMQPAVAIRGDRLALFPTTVDADGAVIDFLGVIEIDGQGRPRRNVQFDADDSSGAQNALDELYLEQLSSTQAATLRPGLRFRDAFSARGTDDLAAVMAPGFVAIDHRSMAWPDLDHAGFVDANRERGELLGPALVFTTDIHRIEGDLVVASNRMTGISPEVGAEWLQEFVNIFICHDDQVHGLENFAADDLEGAMARADELLGHRTGPDLRQKRR